MFKKAKIIISRALLLAVLSIGLAFALPAPTHAYTCYGSWGGNLHLYDYINLGGRDWYTSEGGKWINTSLGGFDNQASSVYNASACTAILAEGQDGSGYRITIRSGEWYNLGYGWNNIVSSVYLY